MEKYQKIRVLGKGSFGCAILASNKAEGGKKYVIKELDVTNISKAERQAAQQEAQVLAQMHHPNIVACKEYVCLFYSLGA